MKSKSRKITGQAHSRNEGKAPAAQSKQLRKEGQIYGYARISTDGQSLDAQVEQLIAEGAQKVFRETASGVLTQRPQLNRLVNQLSEGDLLLVTRIDRLGRSTRDLLNTLYIIADKGAMFRSLAETWADMTSPYGYMLVVFLSGVAQFERYLIDCRTKEGRAHAIARGVKMGRKHKLTAHQRHEALKRKDAGEPVRDIARSYDVHHSMISRLKPML
jgi:DNA invertase Pin-like site-specific DNA recombinase